MAPLFKSHPDYRPGRKRAKTAGYQRHHIAIVAIVALASLAIGTAFGANFYRVIKQDPPQAGDQDQHAMVPATDFKARRALTKNKPSFEETSEAAKINGAAPSIIAGNSSDIADPVPGRTAQKSAHQAIAPSQIIAATDKPDQTDDHIVASVFSRPPIIDIAETEADTIDIEIKMAALNVEHFRLPTKSIAVASRPPADLRKGQTTKFANLRAGPDNDAQVLEIIPAKSTILAEEDCVHWCRAVYLGQEGFVYKTLIIHSAGTTTDQPPTQ